MWHTIASYPRAKGLVYKERCNRCGRVKKIRIELPDLTTSGRSSAGDGSLGPGGWFLAGILFASVLFAVVNLRACG